MLTLICFFFASLQVSQLRFFHSWDLFVSSSFSCRLSLHSYLSSQVLPLRQQADRFWMSHPVCLIPSALSVSPPPLSLLMPLQCFSQPKRAKEGVASLSMNSFPHTFPLLLPSASSHLRQSDIYRGTLHLLGSSCSFLAKEHSIERWKARGCKRGLLKRVKKLKSALENCNNNRDG